MAKTPAGDVLDSQADQFFIDAPQSHGSRLGDSEEARCRALYVAAIASHFTAILNPSACDEPERANSRRILVSTIPEFAETRNFLCDAAGFDPEQVRNRAVALLADAQQREKCMRQLRRVNLAGEHPAARQSTAPALAAE